MRQTHFNCPLESTQKLSHICTALDRGSRNIGYYLYQCVRDKSYMACFLSHCRWILRGHNQLRVQVPACNAWILRALASIFSQARTWWWCLFGYNFMFLHSYHPPEPPSGNPVSHDKEWMLQLVWTRALTELSRALTELSRAKDQHRWLSQT